MSPSSLTTVLVEAETRPKRGQVGDKVVPCFLELVSCGWDKGWTGVSGCPTPHRHTLQPSVRGLGLGLCMSLHIHSLSAVFTACSCSDCCRACGAPDVQQQLSSAQRTGICASNSAQSSTSPARENSCLHRYRMPVPGRGCTAACSVHGQE